MKDTGYLIFNKSGITGFRKSLPNLSAGHYATKVIINVDDKYFNQAISTTTLNLDSSNIISPKIDIDVDYGDI